jgi:hypothetical protein
MKMVSSKSSTCKVEKIEESLLLEMLERLSMVEKSRVLELI